MKDTPPLALAAAELALIFIFSFAYTSLRWWFVVQVYLLLDICHWRCHLLLLGLVLLLVKISEHHRRVILPLLSIWRLQQIDSLRFLNHLVVGAGTLLELRTVLVQTGLGVVCEELAGDEAGRPQARLFESALGFVTGLVGWGYI